MTFVIYFKDGSKESFSRDCDDSDEQTIDAIYDEIYASYYHEIDYIDIV